MWAAWWALLSHFAHVGGTQHSAARCCADAPCVGQARPACRGAGAPPSLAAATGCVAVSAGGVVASAALEAPPDAGSLWFRSVGAIMLLTVVGCVAPRRPSGVALPQVVLALASLGGLSGRLSRCAVASASGRLARGARLALSARPSVCRRPQRCTWRLAACVHGRCTGVQWRRRTVGSLAGCSWRSRFSHRVCRWPRRCTRRWRARRALWVQPSRAGVPAAVHAASAVRACGCYRCGVGVPGARSDYAPAVGGRSGAQRCR